MVEFTYTNYFCLKPEEYVRDFDPIRNYIKIQSFFISRMTGKPLDKTAKWVLENMKPGGKFPIKDKKVKYLSRMNSIDRYKAVTTLTGYVNTIRKNNFIMSPAWTAYQPSYMGESLYVSYIDWKSKERKAYKDAMFIAEQRGDKEAIRFNDEMQSSSKIGINSISGASVMPATINHCQSLHPTLTSTCANSTALANLNNEKLIAGNRPYLNFQSVVDNICAIVISASYDELDIAVKKYKIHLPTVKEVMDVIHYSSDEYWRDRTQSAKIESLVEKLTPMERAAFVYTGDLYHLYKYNPLQVKEFFKGFTTRTYEELPFEEAEKYFKMADTDVRILAKLLCKDYMMGKTDDDVKLETPNRYTQICANMRNIMLHLEDYKHFVMAFLRPTVVSPRSYRYSTTAMKRKAVLTSDTDSTIFTAQWWVKELTGRIAFEDEHYNVGFAVSYLVNKTVFHQLCMMSSNMGIETKNLSGISMKNEYYFPTYVITNASKTYYAFKSVREGNVYREMKLEKKGVLLRSAKIPKNVMNQFDDYICFLMNEFIKKQYLTINDLLEKPYRTEVEIKNSILKGEPKYFQSAQIKSPDSYKLGNNAPPVFYHELWEEVFAPKYGDTPPLPYTVIKITTGLNTNKKTNDWIDNFEDKAMADRMRKFLAKKDRKDLQVIQIPKLTIGTKPLPVEIADAMDVGKQIMSVMSPYYLSLESYGLYMRDKDNSCLIHQRWKPKDEIEKTA